MPEVRLVEEFVKQYERELDFYASAAQLVQQHIEGALRSSGIKAIVTSRAKRPESVETKLRKRIRKGAQFADFGAIRADLADLAGVRVALYFPGQRAEVNNIVAGSFPPVQVPKEHPDTNPKSPANTVEGTRYGKRFAGYSATHHRVQLYESQVPDDDKRMTTAIVEVQIASVLMHAWAEVEHDLIYKPLSGTLSTDEHSVLDEINGLAIAGEIALERLQRARDARIASQEGPFESQYELASYLFDHVYRVFKTEARQEAMGHADWLFELLSRLGLNSREKITTFLDALQPEFERRTIAEQVIDQVVEGDKQRYEMLESLRGGSPYASPSQDVAHLTLGRFIDHWVALEGCLGRIVRTVLGPRPGPTLPFRELEQLVSCGILTSDTVSRFHEIRRLRNVVLHGAGREVNPGVLEDALHGMENLLRNLAASQEPTVRNAALEALAMLGVSPPASVT